MKYILAACLSNGMEKRSNVKVRDTFNSISMIKCASSFHRVSRLNKFCGKQYDRSWASFTDTTGMRVSGFRLEISTMKVT
jgi:hypothetical protein